MTLPLETAGPKVVGVDPSLTSTGLAVIHHGSAQCYTIRPGGLRDHERLAYLGKKVASWCEGADLIVIEGGAYAAKFQAFDLGGLFWVLTHYLWIKDMRYAVVPPACLKKYVTGSGGGAKASKDRVLAAAINRFGGTQIDGNDQADALGLAAMGADWLGFPIAQMPVAHRQVLATIKWPAHLKPAA